MRSGRCRARSARGSRRRQRAEHPSLRVSTAHTPPSATGSRATASARPWRVRRAERAVVQLARSRARSSAEPTSPGGAAGRPRRAPARRRRSRPHAHVVGVVEDGQQVLDDPVGRQLDAGGQHARTALHLQAGGRAARPAQRARRCASVGRARSGRVVVAQDADDRRASRRACGGCAPRSCARRVAAATSGSGSVSPSASAPSSPRRRCSRRSSSPDSRARSVATSRRARSSRAARSSAVRTSSSSTRRPRACDTPEPVGHDRQRHEQRDHAEPGASAAPWRR